MGIEKALRLYGVARAIEDDRLQAQKQDFENQKYVITKLTDLYQQTESLAMRENIVASMKQSVGTMNPRMQQALQPFLMGGPLDPMEEKKRRFESVKGPRPQTTVTPEESPELYARQSWLQKDYDRMAQKLLLGVEAPDEKAFMFSSEKNAFVSFRGTDGSIQTMPAEAEQFKASLDAANMTWPQVLSSGGWVDEEKQIKEMGKQIYEVTVRKNIFTGQKTINHTSQGAVPGASELRFGQPPELLKELMLSYDLEDQEHPDKKVQYLRDQLDVLLKRGKDTKEKEVLANQLLRKYVPGWNIRIVEQAKIDPGMFERILFRFGAKDSKDTMIAVPGEMTKIDLPDGTFKAFFWDRANGHDIAYTFNGEHTNMTQQEYVEYVLGSYNAPKAPPPPLIGANVPNVLAPAHAPLKSSQRDKTPAVGIQSGKVVEEE